MKSVTVVIPCYNYGDYITEALNSVLCQTFQDFEIIIVDDGSDDSTKQVLKSWESHPKVTVLRVENGGPSRARNIGIQNSNSKYILPLDADDRVEETYLEKAVKVLDENDKVGIVYCKAEIFGSVNGPWNLPAYSFPEILYQNCIFVSSLFRKEDWIKVKGFDESFSDEWEDFDFWLKIINLGKEVFQIPQILFYYRKGHGSRTVRKHLELFPIYKKLVKNHQSLYGNNVLYFIKLILERNEMIESLEVEKVKLLESSEFKLGYYILHALPLIWNKLKFSRKNK